MCNWLKSWFGNVPSVIEGVKPVIDEGEDIIVDITKILADLKSNNFVNVALDANLLLKDVQEFVAVVQQVAAEMKSQEKM